VTNLLLSNKACMQAYATKIRRQDVPAFKDGKQALYISKLMLVKMAHKDWTPIDRQWVTSQAKRLRAVIPSAVHFGCEGTLIGNSVDAPLPLNMGNTESLSKDVDLEVKVPSELAKAVKEIVHVLVNAENPDVVTLKLQIPIDDHELRLGRLKVAETDIKDARNSSGQAAAGVPDVDEHEVIADVKLLENRIAGVLRLHQPGKDSQQFQCGLPHFRLDQQGKGMTRPGPGVHVRLYSKRTCTHRGVNWRRMA
jgi:hypothetical protein